MLLLFHLFLSVCLSLSSIIYFTSVLYPPNFSIDNTWSPPKSFHIMSTTLSHLIPARPFVIFFHTALSTMAGTRGGRDPACAVDETAGWFRELRNIHYDVLLISALASAYTKGDGIGDSVFNEAMHAHTFSTRARLARPRSRLMGKDVLHYDFITLPVPLFSTRPFAVNRVRQVLRCARTHQCQGFGELLSLETKGTMPWSRTYL